MEVVDLVVVGAGLYGITAAVTYHRLHPTARVLLLEASGSIGGPWASHRIFPGLVTNNLVGTYAHPDFPMDEEKFGIMKGEHVPAATVAKYLKYVIREGEINDCLRLRTKVDVVEKVHDGWLLHCSPTNDSSTIKTAKLIIAIGLTDQPVMPKYPTSTEFKPIVTHSKDFPTKFSDIIKPSTHTLVIGAGKSAWDIAYACCTQKDATATMLIRPSGNGPTWMSPSHVTPLGLWLEKLVFTRFFGFFSPCPWAEAGGFEGWIRGLLHRTWIGRKIVGAFWGILSEDVVTLNKLNEHPETKKLRPWRNAFEVGTALSIHNYPTNFFDLVREGRIKIVVGEVDKLNDSKEVTLKSGEKLQVDAVVCATGWNSGSTIKFKPEGLEKELGLPTGDPSQNDGDAILIKKVESDIYSRFPFLKERDTSRTHHPDPALRYVPTADDQVAHDPFRLYRFLVPPSDLNKRSIGFVGALMTLGNAPCAYIQSIWLAAYLDGTLALPDTLPEQVMYETYRETQYGVIRNCMGYANKFPDLVFDSLPYFDVLMRDLGFKNKRKGSVLGLTNWGRECFRSYGPEDYVGLVQEWQEKVEREAAQDKKND
ncbi:flavin-binding monooxygenase-like protein-like protein [Polyplosphaeria fusca]|uniref:Flavin-binding monooxygenase-like protein-like protein n=1 Tax=Polyplosphaeria fusca TaxID=682080 RepID=A0A9P4UZP7_9PLEO|nr:flavin-binding monooxygenase-like protein-like protein [Polyplosphaeria fusca]